MSLAFDCLKSLFQLHGFRGVNISVGIGNSIPLGTGESQIFDGVRREIRSKALELLNNNPQALLTIAVGNDQQRLENIWTSPATDLCTDSNCIGNLFCVTGYDSGGIEDGSFASPYPVLYRFSNSPNVVAMTTKKNELTTSWLAPRLLIELIRNPSLNFEESYVRVPDLTSSGEELFQIRTLP